MLQRIQSIFLLLGSLALLASLFTAQAVFVAGDKTINFSAYGLLSEQNTTVSLRWPYVLMLATIGIPLLGFGASIFQYKNRKNQIKTIRFFSLWVLLHVAAEAFLYSQALADLKKLYPTETFVTHWGMGSIFPLLSIALSILAVSRIKHDEELVRSADRIR